MTNALIFWITGWIIFSIGYFIINYYTDIYSTKKLLAYRSFTIGIISWIGIIFYFVFLIVIFIMCVDEWIESKLS